MSQNSVRAIFEKDRAPTVNEKTEQGKEHQEEHSFPMLSP
jgi:hypothetical protein